MYYKGLEMLEYGHFYFRSTHIENSTSFKNWSLLSVGYCGFALTTFCAYI